jgi:hypothetical protein
MNTLVRLNPPTDLTFTPSGPITCLTTAISVQLTTTNGVTPLTYTIVVDQLLILLVLPQVILQDLLQVPFSGNRR